MTHDANAHSPATQACARSVRIINGDFVLAAPARHPQGDDSAPRAGLEAVRRRIRDGEYDHAAVLLETARRILAAGDL